MKSFEVRQEPINCLEDLSRIPMAFEVKSFFEVIHREPDVIELGERWLEKPYLKDYDAIPHNRPIDLPGHFDLSNWCLLSARHDERWIGGALIAWKTSGVDMLENRDDLAVLWDLRVNPGDRRRGVASALFEQAAIWAQSRGCRSLKIESQNNNVPACQFYASRGCRLIDVHPGVYSDFPEEIQLLWYKDLA